MRQNGIVNILNLNINIIFAFLDSKINLISKSEIATATKQHFLNSTFQYFNIRYLKSIKFHILGSFYRDKIISRAPAGKCRY